MQLGRLAHGSDHRCDAAHCGWTSQPTVADAGINQLSTNSINVLGCVASCKIKLFEFWHNPKYFHISIEIYPGINVYYQHNLVLLSILNLAEAFPTQQQQHPHPCVHFLAIRAYAVIGNTQKTRFFTGVHHLDFESLTAISGHNLWHTEAGGSMPFVLAFTWLWDVVTLQGNSLFTYLVRFRSTGILVSATCIAFQAGRPLLPTSDVP